MPIAGRSALAAPACQRRHAQACQQHRVGSRFRNRRRHDIARDVRPDEELKKLYDEKLISQEVYDAKQRELLDEK